MSKRRYKSTTQEIMDSAIEKIKKGEMSITKCSKEFGIAKGTLINRLKNKHTKTVGRPTALSSEEERSITNSLITVSEWGYPFDARTIKVFVKTYLDLAKKIEKPFGENNLPGNEWLRKFLRRNGDKLSMRFCQNLKLSKAKVSPSFISDYFEKLKVSLTAENGDFIPPERYFKIIIFILIPRYSWLIGTYRY